MTASEDKKVKQDMVESKVNKANVHRQISQLGSKAVKVTKDRKVTKDLKDIQETLVKRDCKD